jgi:uncharacterized membrane protein
MRATLTATLCLTAALLALSSSPGRADFRVCNSSGAQLKLAFGNNDSRYGWTSRGWWTLPAGACQNVLYGEIPPGNYYVYALDSASRPLPVPEAQTGGTFCIKDEAAFDLRSSSFMTPQNTIACEANGLKGVKFRAVEVSETQSNYTHNLVPNNMGGMSALVPLIKEAVQNLERPASSPQVVTLPAPQVSAQTPAQLRPAPPVGTACQRYPNLC